MKTLTLGFEIGTGEPVEIPLKHMAITGQTQEAGKTTALEGLIARSGLRAVTFITKRGEASFTNARRIDPYFREQADWQFVASILEASRGEKLKFERAWIIRATKGADSLADVQRNVQRLMVTAKGMNADVYLTLDAYLEAVVPQIEKVRWAPKLELEDGINVVDLTGINVEMQHLVIKSTITWVLEREKDTIVVVPEAWKFIPQGRGTPVKLAAESFIRQAAALRNFLWLDSQDIAGVDKIILKSVPVWILGVQREANEIKRTLDNIPDGLPRLKPADISTLGLGQFYACWGRHAIKTYVQPEWLSAQFAVGVAKALVEPGYSIEHVRKMYEPQKKEPTDMADKQLEQENADLRRQLNEAQEQIKRLSKKPHGPAVPAAEAAAGTPAPSPEVKFRDAGGGPTQTINLGDMDINAIEREIGITFTQEKRVYETTGVRGRIMFAIVHELQNTPAREADIIRAMTERGWNHPRQSVSPELAKLVKMGDLVRDDATFRLPGKLILTIDGKPVKP